MNFAEEFRLFEEVSKGAAYWQIEVYNYKGNRWETSRGNRVLKAWERGNFHQAREQAIELAKTSMVKVALPYKGADGGYLLDNAFYLVDEPQGREIDLKNLLDLERAAKFLAKLHKLSLFQMGEAVLSMHIMSDTLYVGKYGELILWGFENLRIEDPLLSLAHLLYDCQNEKAKDFVYQKYTEIRPLDLNKLKKAESQVWDSAVLLGHSGKKEIGVKPTLEKIQELIDSLWPLLSQQEFINLPVSSMNIPISEFLQTQAAYPSTYNVAEFSDTKTSEFASQDIEEFTNRTLNPCEEELLKQELEMDLADESLLEEASWEIVSEISEEASKDIKTDLSIEEETEETKKTEEKKAEPISWKPFPKLPTRRW